MNAFRSVLAKKNKHLVQSIALALMIGLSFLLYLAAEAGALAGLVALLAAMGAIMALTMAAS